MAPAGLVILAGPPGRWLPFMCGGAPGYELRGAEDPPCERKAQLVWRSERLNLNSFARQRREDETRENIFMNLHQTDINYV